MASAAAMAPVRPLCAPAGTPSPHTAYSNLPGPLSHSATPLDYVALARTRLRAPKVAESHFRHYIIYLFVCSTGFNTTTPQWSSRINIPQQASVRLPLGMGKGGAYVRCQQLTHGSYTAPCTAYLAYVTAAVLASLHTFIHPESNRLASTATDGD